jgi:hypothetical protein
MIRTRARPVEKLQASVLPMGGLDDVRLEILEGKQAGARAGDEDAAGADEG